MALHLKTAGPRIGDTDIPDRAPLPDDALGLVDFTTGLHITQAAVATGRAANIVLDRSMSVASSGWFYGRDGIEASAANFWDRIEYDASGRCLGLLLEGGFSQSVNREQRTNLALGTPTGSTLAPMLPPPSDPAAQWWALTPDGAGEASLHVDTGSITQSRILVSWEIRSAGGRYAQIGARFGDDNAWANIDLATGEITAKGGLVEAAAHARPGGGWTVYAIVRKNSGSLGNLQPYVASIAASDAGKLGVAGGPIAVRAPIVRLRNGEGLVPGSPYSHASADSRTADVLRPAASLLSGSVDFTVAFRARSGWGPTQVRAGLLSIKTPGGPVQLRFLGDNTLALTRAIESEILVDIGIVWEPETIYRVGVSRTGSKLAVCVNGTIVEVSHPDIAGMTGWWLLRGEDGIAGAWFGHAQKVILWSGGVNAPDLTAMVDGWV